MEKLFAWYRGSIPSGNPRGYGSEETHADHRLTNYIRGDSNTNVGNVSHSYNNTINVGVNEESLRIQAWLSPLEPHGRHHDVSNRRLDGVGDWLLRKNEFEEWRNGQDGSVNPTLLCYGGQGVGKTYISSLVIDTLCKQARGQNIAVLSLYCDYQAQKDQTSVNMIGNLLRQVTVRAAEIPGEIRSAFAGSKQDGGKSLRLPDMLKLFVKTISSLERVYICFDAVDELLPQNRSEFLRAVRRIIHDAPNTRLFLTGRPYIYKELDKHLAEAYNVHIAADQEDIARYIRQKIDHDDDQNPDLMTENLKNDIMKTLSKRCSEMFLLVALNIDAILGETSLAKRKEMLQKVATSGVDLDSVYAETLQRIREQKGDRSRLGMEVLMWVSHAERPLRIDELRHALAVEMEKRDLDPENIRPQDTVLGSCLGLAMVDRETSTVRLIHYTLQEYLSRPGILPDAHKTLAQSCLAYLNCDKVKELPAKQVLDTGDMPFLEYSSLYWGSHAKVQLSHRAKSLALQLLKLFDDHISATLLLKQTAQYHSCALPNHLFPGLHSASYFGIVELVAALIEMKGCNINQRDCMGRTPLLWAARQGNEQVVRLLLTREDLDPDMPDNYDRTPLWQASFSGHERLVRLLLARNDVNPDKPDDEGQTPLWQASFNGHDGVVRLLLTMDDVNPDKPNNYGQTPLWWASFHGYEGLVRLLLTRNGVNPDKPDYGGRTSLLRASFNGHEGVVRLLLTLDDINPDRPDDDGRTPLWWASFHGHEGVVRLLLTRNDVNPDKKDNGGRTPLSRASIRGQEGVVRLLLTRDDVNPDNPDNDGRTPLWGASHHGHEGVVRLLLTPDDVNPNKADNDGQTPLLRACYHGHEGVVRLLLTRNDVNPDKPDNGGRTPLWGASYCGHKGVVRLLLSRDDVNPDEPNNNGQTPLWWASYGGKAEVVRLLLSRNDINPDKPDNSGETPLRRASYMGYEAVVRLLLSRDDVNPGKPDNRGRTPLQIASQYGHTEIVALLQHRANAIPSPD